MYELLRQERMLTSSGATMSYTKAAKALRVS